MNTIRLLDSHLLPGTLIGLASVDDESAGYRLGFPGLNPRRPSFDIIDHDDSGSVIGVGGTDPLGNRFEEAWRAIKVVSRFANGTAKVGLLSFDQPSSGNVPPGPISSQMHRKRLAAHLRVPPDGIGSSELLPSLTKARELAERHPGHDVRLTILSDFELTDDEPSLVFDQLREFPGMVHAVLLNREAPADLRGDNIVITELRHGDKPGSVATAIHASLTATRPGRRPGSVTINTHPSIPPLSPDAVSTRGGVR